MTKYDKFIEYHGKAAVVNVSAIARGDRVDGIQNIVHEIEGDKNIKHIILNFEGILKQEGPTRKAKILELVFERYNNVIAAGVDNSRRELLTVEYHHFIEKNKRKGKIYSSVEKAITAVSKKYKR